MWGSGYYNDWDWDYDYYNYDYNDVRFRSKIDEKIIEKYITGFDLIKDDLINSSKDTLKKWNFAQKTNDEIIINSLESFKNSLNSRYNDYIKTDEDVVNFFNEIILVFCNDKELEIKNILLNL